MDVSAGGWRCRGLALATLVTLMTVALCGALPGRVSAALLPGLLFLAPALLLAALLVARRYPGERLLERWSARRRPRPRRAAMLARRPRPWCRARLAGGRLIGVSLAGRGPPQTLRC